MRRGAILKVVPKGKRKKGEDVARRCGKQNPYLIGKIELDIFVVESVQVFTCCSLTIVDRGQKQHFMIAQRRVRRRWPFTFLHEGHTTVLTG